MMGLGGGGVGFLALADSGIRILRLLYITLTKYNGETSISICRESMRNL